jgi:hypothetical protein
MCNNKIKKNKRNVQIKKIEHGITNKCTQETEVSVYVKICIGGLRIPLGLVTRLGKITKYASLNEF